MTPEQQIREALRTAVWEALRTAAWPGTEAKKLRAGIDALDAFIAQHAEQVRQLEEERQAVYEMGLRDNERLARRVSELEAAVQDALVVFAGTKWAEAYEGGAWAAFNSSPFAVPDAAESDDVECADWWGSVRLGRFGLDLMGDPLCVGVGGTPGEAVLALVEAVRRHGGFFT